MRFTMCFYLNDMSRYRICRSLFGKWHLMSCEPVLIQLPWHSVDSYRPFFSEHGKTLLLCRVDLLDHRGYRRQNHQNLMKFKLNFCVISFMIDCHRFAKIWEMGAKASSISSEPLKHKKDAVCNVHLHAFGSMVSFFENPLTSINLPATSSGTKTIKNHFKV